MDHILIRISSYVKSGISPHLPIQPVQSVLKLFVPIDASVVVFCEVSGGFDLVNMRLVLLHLLLNRFDSLFDASPFLGLDFS